MSNLKSLLFYLALACLLTPFLFQTATYFPFITLKTTVFRFIVEIMLIVWLIRLSLSQQPTCQLTPLIKNVLIYGLVIFISALLGVNFWWSFFSGNERMEGVFGIWHFILFFLILAATFDWPELKKLLKIQVCLGLVYALVAILAYIGVGTITAKFTSNRLAGYTGNPSYFAAYMIFNAFLALYFYFDQFLLDRKFYNHWLLIFCFESVLIFLSGTRGGMLGYLAALLVVFLGILIFDKKKEYQNLRKTVLIISAIGIIGVVGLFAFKDTTFVKNNFALERFTSISIKDPTAMGRLISFKIAWQSFLEKPLFGWGPENYEEAYFRNFDKRMLDYLPEDLYFDRVHNKPMEVLATTGILGFLSYMSIFVLALYTLWKNQKHYSEKLLPNLALGGMLIGYFTQNIFLFDVQETYLMFFLILAFIASLEKQEISDLSVKPEVKNSRKALLLIILLPFIGYSLIFWVIKPYRISQGIFYTNYYMAYGNGKEALEVLKKNIQSPEPLAGDIVVGFSKGRQVARNLSPEDERPLLNEIIQFINSLPPEKLWFYQAKVATIDLESIAGQWQPELLAKAQKEAEELVKLSPYLPDPHLLLAKICILNNKFDEALKEAQKVLELNPYSAPAHFILFLAYGNKGEIAEADKHLVAAAKLHYPFNNVNVILRVVSLLVAEKDYQTIAELYLSAINLEPKNVQLYISLAATYGKLRNKEKAIFYAKKALEVNSGIPNLKQAVDDFIRIIENEEWDKIAD